MPASAPTYDAARGKGSNGSSAIGGIVLVVGVLGLVALVILLGLGRRTRGHATAPRWLR